MLRKVSHPAMTVTKSSLIPRKPTGIGAQYFLYRYGTKCDHHRKGLKANEGADRRNYCEVGELTGSSRIKLHYFQIVLS